MFHGPPEVSEDRIKVKHDLPLVRRLLGYTRPYWHIVLLALLALLLNSGFDLGVPYVVKTAIDRYVTPHWVFYTGATERFSHATRPWRGDTVLLNLSELPRSTRKVLETRGEIPHQKLLVYPRVPKDIAERHPGLFLRASPEGPYVLPYDRLGDLSPPEVRRLRLVELAGVARMALILLALLVGSFVFGSALTYLLQYLGQRVMFDMRMEVIEHLLRLPVAYFDKNPVGRLVTRATNDIAAVSELYSSVLVFVAKDFLLIFGIFFVMSRMNRSLTLVILALVPFILITTYLFRLYARTAYRLVRRHLARVNAFVQETLNGIALIQVFNAQRNVLRQFRRINDDLFRAFLRQMYVFAVFRPVIEIFSAVAVALVVWHGGGQIIKGALTFGALVAFLSYIDMMFHPIRDLAEKYNIFQSALAGAERVFTLLQEPPEPEGTQDLQEVRGEIVFEDVWFAYNPDEWVLKGVSFRIRPEETVALVGPTGAGKTSIMSLMLGFYRPQKGRILIDGVDIRNLRLSTLRRIIGVVFQDVFLLEGTVLDNLKLHQEIPEPQLERALKITRLQEVVQRLPQGLNTPVGEGGRLLSAGERQLLSFARALARDPKILLMDEATSSVDSYSEYLIEQALRAMLKGKTAVIIAHRLSTVRHADRILVVVGGRIVEEGTHEDLLKKGGVYSHLYRIQFGEAPAAAADPPEAEGPA